MYCIILKGELRRGHPQLASIDIIPCADEDVALEFCEGIVPKCGEVVAIAKAIGNDLFPIDGILRAPDLKALPVERHSI